MADTDLYKGREQTLIKHFILERYLQRLALIVGTWAESITYIDCFSGPWKIRGEEYQDSSFGIAIAKLREAREKLSQQKKSPRFSCLFLERDPEPYAELKIYADSVSDIPCHTIHGSFEEHIGDILSFVKDKEPTFPFFFIDPTGWKGFPLKSIRPLLTCSPGEVLINFMTSHARRFIDMEQERENFDGLFGDSDWRQEMPDGSPDERDDALVRLYADRVKRVGGFSFVSYTPVLHPQVNTTFFHLVYASRHQKGLEVFKDVEESAAEVAERTRAEVLEQSNAPIRSTSRRYDMIVAPLLSLGSIGSTVLLVIL